MQAENTTKKISPRLIGEAQQVYESQPVAAALMLYDGISRHDKLPTYPAGQEVWHQPTASHGENLLRTAIWTIKVMGEDARVGIAPTPTEWDMNISVAESIIRMLEGTNDPT